MIYRNGTQSRPASAEMSRERHREFRMTIRAFPSLDNGGRDRVLNTPTRVDTGQTIIDRRTLDGGDIAIMMSDRSPWKLILQGDSSEDFWHNELLADMQSTSPHI